MPNAAAEANSSQERTASTSGQANGTDLSKERALVEEANSALNSLDFATARTTAEAAVDKLLARHGGERDDAWLRLLDEAGRTAWEAHDTQAASRAWTVVGEVRSRTLPEDSSDLQTTRLNLARTIRELGDLRGALALAEQVLDVRSRTLPEDHPDLQTTRLSVAGMVRSLGNLDSARALEEQVLEVRSRTLPDEHPDLQDARGNLAITLRQLGDLVRARELQEKVLEVRSRTLHDDHPDLQLARQSLAITMLQSRDTAGAHALLEKVLEVGLRTLPDDHPRLQATRGNLAQTLHLLGDFSGARALQEKVLETFQRTLPDDHHYLQAARANLALTIMQLGDLPGARALQARTLEIALRTLPDGHPDLQAARMNLAVTISAMGDLAGARTLFEKALEMRSRTLADDHRDLQDARHGLANTLAELGDLDGARELEEKVLEVRSRTLPDDHADLTSTRGNLASTLHAMGDLEGARALRELVLEARSRTLPHDHPDLLAARQGLANTLSHLGDLAGARELEEQVLEVRSRTLPDDRPELQAARQNLAITLVAEATRSPKESAGGVRCFELLAARSAAHRRAAKTVLLEATPREAEARCARLVEDLGFDLSLAAGLGALHASEEFELPCFTLSEATRGAALGSATVMRFAAGAPEYGKLREKLAMSSKAVADLAVQGTTSEEFRLARERREVLERELVALGTTLGGTRLGAVEFDARRFAATLSARDAVVAYRRYLRLRVSFPVAGSGPQPTAPAWTGEESLCAFVLRRGGSQSERDAGAPNTEPELALVELGPIAPIEAAVREWREALGSASGRGVSVASRNAGGELTARGAVVRELVFDPLQEAIGDAERVILVLDDVLHLVPFDVLPSEDGEHELLGDRLRIETRATAMELLASVPKLEGAGELLAIGGVAFDEREPSVELAGVLRGGNFGGFAPLPATGEEVEALASSYVTRGNSATASLLTGEEATRERLIELAPRARWLHVATHGWFASKSIRSWSDPEPLDKLSGLGMRQSGEEQVKGMSPMLLCGLALAGANQPENAVGRAPGLITAQEIAALDLAQCELAVLSACDTNVGVREQRAGQGVASLQMALQMAGARSVITSLWKVPDEATKELMLDFYRRMWVENKPKWQALKEAKRRLRDAKDAEGNAKYTLRDWAAWVLTGEPD